MMKKRIGMIAALLFGLAVTESKACGPCYYTVRDMVPHRMMFFGLDRVRLLDSPFRHAMELNADWMHDMDIDRLLANYRTNAGLPPKTEPYGSWESMGIAGHTLGHYLTAISQQYAATADERFKSRIDYIVAELDSCQVNFVNGFIGGMPGGDKVFKELKKGIITTMGFDLNGLWVPWYNEHKIMTGLADAYKLAGNRQALHILVHLADYLSESIAGLSEEQLQQMLECEFGGMNEIYAELYALTGRESYREDSYKFYHARLMNELARGVDVLPGLHSNTQVPKIVGSIRQYELTGNPRDSAIADFFWTTMVKNHSYVNGSNSMGEYLGAPGALNERLSNATGETCNTYNMLKLSRHLYGLSGEVKYMDYYERALYNHILASQHPQTGMTTYFTPLAMRTRKEYSSKLHSFTCCMGSGFENHSKYGESIYATDQKEDLFVNLYIPSVLNWKEKGIHVTLETEYPSPGPVTLTLRSVEPQTFTLYFRRPAWMSGECRIRVNGKSHRTVSGPGYVGIARTWTDGDRVEVTFPMHLYTESMPDNPDRLAFFYGPTLLAGILDGEQFERENRVPVLVAARRSDLTGKIHPTESPLQFVSRGLGEPEDIHLEPFFSTADRYYTVYWDYFTPTAWRTEHQKHEAERRRRAELDKITVDLISLGEMQPERDHGLEGEHTRIADFRSRKYRHAFGGGWFAFRMRTDPEAVNRLLVTCWGGDGRYDFTILADGKPMHTGKIEGPPDEFIDLVIDLPLEITRGRESLTVRFETEPQSRIPGIYDCRMVRIDH